MKLPATFVIGSKAVLSTCLEMPFSLLAVEFSTLRKLIGGARCWLNFDESIFYCIFMLTLVADWFPLIVLALFC